MVLLHSAEWSCDFLYEFQRRSGEARPLEVFITGLAPLIHHTRQSGLQVDVEPSGIALVLNFSQLHRKLALADYSFVDVIRHRGVNLREHLLVHTFTRERESGQVREQPLHSNL